MGGIFTRGFEERVLQSLERQEARQEAAFRRQEEASRRQETTLNGLVALNGLLLAPLNVYDAMSQTSAGRKDDLKESLCEEFGYDKGTCMLTGVRGKVTLAHILPLSAGKNIGVISLLELEQAMLNESDNSGERD
jgi:hypothetical protein